MTANFLELLEYKGINDPNIILIIQVLCRVNVVNCSTLDTHFATLWQNFSYLLKPLPIISKLVEFTLKIHD